MFILRGYIIFTALCALFAIKSTKLSILRLFAFAISWWYIAFCLVVSRYNHKNIMLTIIESLGVTFIKLGQFLSMRQDIIGHQNAQILANLRDNLPEIAYSRIQTIINNELGEKISQIAYINPKAVASASVAQVHKATLCNGDTVAIKVIKPNIIQSINRDILIATIFFWMLSFLAFKWKRLRFKEIFATFATNLKTELILTFEAAATEDFAAKNGEIIVPKIYWNLTTTKVMIMNWINGASISNNINDNIQNIRNPKHIATTLMNTFLHQAFNNGIFHADMHSGNILITPESKIALLDFGSMGKLDERERKFLVTIFYGFLQQDYKLVAQTHIDAGYVPKDTDLYLFTLSCRIIGKKFISQAASEIEASKMLDEFFSASAKFGMVAQPHLLQFQRSILMIEGMLHSLDCNLNIWNTSKPWFEDWAKTNLTRKAILVSKLKNEALKIIKTLKDHI
jgi:ubiquinone biosynthesis protein